MLLTHYFLPYTLGNKYTYLGGVVCLQKSRDISWNTNVIIQPPGTKSQYSFTIQHSAQSYNSSHTQKKTLNWNEDA